jgi:hypothetical protein
MLVCVGCALVMLVSVAFAERTWPPHEGNFNINVDPARIAYGVMAGIGFLGAGTIIKHEVSVRGLTTAAAMWCVAAIGLAAGLSECTRSRRHDRHRLAPVVLDTSRTPCRRDVPRDHHPPAVGRDVIDDTVKRMKIAGGPLRRQLPPTPTWPTSTSAAIAFTRQAVFTTSPRTSKTAEV